MDSSHENSRSWTALSAGNPLLDGQRKMLRENKAEFANAEIGKVVVYSVPRGNTSLRRGLYMMTHLERP